MHDMNNLTGEELVLLSSAVAIFFAQDKTPAELNALALFFSSISSSIATIAATKLPNPQSNLNQTETEIILGI